MNPQITPEAIPNNKDKAIPKNWIPPWVPDVLFGKLTRYYQM